jgi:hypothetical protein
VAVIALVSPVRRANTDERTACQADPARFGLFAGGSAIPFNDLPQREGYALDEVCAAIGRDL